MNDIMNNFLLAGYKFMHKLYLRQSRFTGNACLTFITKRKTTKIKTKGYKIFLTKQAR